MTRFIDEIIAGDLCREVTENYCSIELTFKTKSRGGHFIKFFSNKNVVNQYSKYKKKSH